MLQQTRVKTVIPYFKNFIQKYPTLSKLSEAKIEDILSLWAGLGYYNRAKNIHKSAKIINEIYKGIFPDSYDKIILLPGIGPYTAGAILSIAFNQKIPILDGNIKRVLTRYFGIYKPLSYKIEKKLWEIQKILIPNNNPRDFNQAIMELGAIICLPKASPHCSKCPLYSNCMALKLNMTQSIPFFSKKLKKQKLFFLYIIFQFKNHFLIYQKKMKNF